MVLRMAGNPPHTAHSPMTTSRSHISLNFFSVSIFSVLQQPPSTIPRWHRCVKFLISVKGDLLNDTNSTMSNISVSISSIDIWHPKHPARDTVATVFFSKLMSLGFVRMFRLKCSWEDCKSNARSPKGWVKLFPLTIIAPVGQIRIAFSASASESLASCS